MRTNLFRRTLAVFAAVVAMAATMVMGASPAQAAWGTQYNVAIQVTGASQNLGSANGWVQFDTNGTTFRYSITICRQSSYTPPNLTVATNRTNYNYSGNYVTTHYGGSSCTTVTGQHNGATLNALFVLTGNTFVGSTFTTFDQDRQVSNPY